MIKEFKSLIPLIDEYCIKMQDFFQSETKEKSFDLNLHYFFITIVIKNVDIINSTNILFK